VACDILLKTDETSSCVTKWRFDGMHSYFMWTELYHCLLFC